jgi:two-component system, OmpR family, sensor histidine kinase SenX3
VAHNDSSQPLASLRRSAGRVLTGLAAGAAFGAAATALMRTRQRGAPRPEVRTAPVADSRPWEAATDLLRTGVCLVDDHNRVLYTNRAAALAATGTPRSRSPSRSWASRAR